MSLSVKKLKHCNLRNTFLYQKYIHINNNTFPGQLKQELQNHFFFVKTLFFRCISRFIYQFVNISVYSGVRDDPVRGRIRSMFSPSWKSTEEGVVDCSAPQASGSRLRTWEEAASGDKG